MRRDEGTGFFLWPDIDQLVSFLIVFVTNCEPPKSVRGFECNRHPADPTNDDGSESRVVLRHIDGNTPH